MHKIAVQKAGREHSDVLFPSLDGAYLEFVFLEKLRLLESDVADDARDGDGDD